mmetsp:Transcript_2704/g.7703  ORF Transcript_2704/g.7703 Transcript_2704/m.7703 type:complete len:200 (+) Transcript_2704:1929-2528(+)
MPIAIVEIASGIGTPRFCRALLVTSVTASKPNNASTSRASNDKPAKGSGFAVVVVRDSFAAAPATAPTAAAAAAADVELAAAHVVADLLGALPASTRCGGRGSQHLRVPTPGVAISGGSQEAEHCKWTTTAVLRDPIAMPRMKLTMSTNGQMETTEGSATARRRAGTTACGRTMASKRSTRVPDRRPPRPTRRTRSGGE